LAVPFVFAASAVSGANIVLNSNFGSGDLTSWTVNGASSHPWGVLSDADAYTGDTYYAETGCVGAPCITGTTGQQASLAQVLTTVNGSTQGNGASTPNGTANELDVLWDGVSVLDLGPGGTLGPVFPFQLYVVTGLVGTGSDTLTFLGRQDPGYNALDNVCVSTGTVCGTTTPEPASALFMGAGLIALAGVGRVRARRNRRG
jgi:hypothetical protein